ncbi:MAG: TIGR02710 family CRISPR-associated CARF protein [Candidatus Bathyarchaeia archaeon]
MKRCRALIATVGLSKAPIEFSAQKYNPEIIYLICTDESLTNATELKNDFEKKCICRINVVSNGSESSQIMEKIYKITKDLYASGVGKDEIVIDGTGGTKPMSAGAMIAAATLGLRNIYVEVLRDEKGNVLPKTMRIYELPDPYEALAEYYAEIGVQELNRHEYASAITIFKRLYEQSSNFTRRKLWEGLTELSEALDASDKFSHQEALVKIDRAIQMLTDYCRESRVIACEKILEKIEAYRASLSKLSDETLILDRVLNLFVNARMRLRNGKYDDAVARYYRTLEALAHWALQADCGYTVEQIKQDRISLDRAYEILLENNHLLGLKYKQDGGGESQKGRFRGMLELRNNSILAHGWRPVREKAAKRFAEFTESYLKAYCEFKGIDLQKALMEYTFPTLPPIRTLLYR